MCCNSLDEQTILLSLFGNRALYLILSFIINSIITYNSCDLYICTVNPQLSEPQWSNATNILFG